MASRIAPEELATALQALARQAREIAVPIAASARRSTTLGRERAILRLLGVNGIDREGRPLAAEVVDRFVGGSRDRLAVGAALPFALALVEYDSTPQALALDIAGGSVDLQIESRLLADPVRRGAAFEHLRSLVDGAMDRIDANRVARRELIAMLGDRRPPGIGTTLREPFADAAVGEAVALVRAGMDVLLVSVPVGRELATRLGELGQEVAWRPRPGDADAEPAPAGSQRGFARLRDELDAAAAERGAYVRLAIVPTALATPEGAVVAAFERADVLDLDPMAEIVVTGVDPDRALADFAFAARVARRAGAVVHLGAGPLVVAPDLDAGVNSDSATRSGRALALQLVAVEVARLAGTRDDQLMVGALPSWIAGEPNAAPRAHADVALRRMLFPGIALSFVEPPAEERSNWPAIVGAILPGTGVGMIVRRVAAASFGNAEVSLRTRAAADVAAELEVALGARPLLGLAADHAVAAVDAGGRLLEALERDGWVAATGSVAGSGWGRLGGESVAPVIVAEDEPDALERALA